MGQLSNLDHLAVIGVTLLTQIKSIYINHEVVLAESANNTTSISRQLANEAETTAGSALISTIDSLSMEAASIKNTTVLQEKCASPINTMAASYCTNMLSNNTARRLRGYATISVSKIPLQ